MARIKIPINFSEQYSLFKNIYKKHVADGEDSILHSIYDMEKEKERMDKAYEHHKKAKEYAMLAEKETEVENSVINSPRMKPFKKRSKRRHWFNMGIFIILIVLIALWWQGRNKHTKPASLDDTVQQIIVPASS